MVNERVWIIHVCNVFQPILKNNNYTVTYLLLRGIIFMSSLLWYVCNAEVLTEEPKPTSFCFVTQLSRKKQYSPTRNYFLLFKNCWRMWVSMVTHMFSSSLCVCVVPSYTIKWICKWFYERQYLYPDGEQLLSKNIMKNGQILSMTCHLSLYPYSKVNYMFHFLSPMYIGFITYVQHVQNMLLHAYNWLGHTPVTWTSC